MRDTTEQVGYRGPPRKAEDVIAAVLSDPEIQRQLAVSLEAERRGDSGTPLKELQARVRRARSA